MSKEAQTEKVEPAGEGEAGSPKTGKHRLLVAAAVGAIVLAGGGLAAWHFLFPGDREADSTAAQEHPLPAPVGRFVELPEIIARLTPPTGNPARLVVVLELDEDVTLEPGQDVLPTEAFGAFLTTRSKEQLAGASALYRLKADLLARTRALLPGKGVRSVLIKSVFVQ